MRLTRILFSFIFLAACGLAVPAAFADIVQYAVTVDTSSLSGDSDYLDLQFNPSSFATQLAFAAVTNFSTDGALDLFGADTFDGTSGDVSGALPLSGAVTFDNGTSTNEYTQGITFGSTISFDVDLSGPAIDSPNGQGGGTFTLDFLDSSGDNLFTNSASGAVFAVDINPDGSATATAFPDPNGGPSVAAFSGPTVVPEPSTALLLGAGLLAIAALRGRRALKLRS